MMFEAVDFPGIFLSLTWHPVGGRLYCPVCISQSRPPAPIGWGTRTDVVNHLKVAHLWRNPEGPDALSAAELTKALAVWRLEQELAADAFGESLLLVRDVNDFLDECKT